MDKDFPKDAFKIVIGNDYGRTWQMRLEPTHGLVFNVTTNGPNKFHRLMQKILLGIHWKRLPQDEEKYQLSITNLPN